jgi:acyl-CoA synthetase (AMP-forming)/AMP-acid ligase II
MESASISRRTQLHGDPSGLFVHTLILEACQKFGRTEAIVDYSSNPLRRICYAEYGELVERLARSLAERFRPGEVIAIFLCNSWEFCASYHAATAAGCVPTLLNPSYREREIRYQLENSEAVALITDGPQISGVNLTRLPRLRQVFATRTPTAGTNQFSDLLHGSSEPHAIVDGDTREVLAALPYSSGTTGLPKGVMLSHSNLVTNVFQTLAPEEEATYKRHDITLCCLPLYHIYGLNVVLNPILAVGGTLVLMPRFDEAKFFHLLIEECPTFLPLVPPLINSFCQAAEDGRFPIPHSVRYVKSGAAPLAPELASRFTKLTGIRIRQGYGMTEASPVTHLGFLEQDLYVPDSIGQAVARTECRLVNGHDSCRGELVMRGPQFMLGYWKAAEATASAWRDGWYWSGDVATVDPNGFYRIVDRVKEMIKYKGFAIAPAEVEAVLLEHPLVRDCGIVGHGDAAAGEIPCAFVVLREGHIGNGKIADELCAYVGERLTHYKQPRQVRFVSSIPRNPSGKILRRILRDEL